MAPGNHPTKAAQSESSKKPNRFMRRNCQPPEASRQLKKEF